MSRRAAGVTRRKVRAIIEDDPDGEWSTDDAIGAQLDMTQQAVTYIRLQEGLPSARVRRRRALNKEG